MTKQIWIVLMIVHVLCDFYFQTEKTARYKQEKLKWVIMHSVMYTGIAVIMILILAPGVPWIWVLAFVMSHAVIDILKFIICNCTLTRERWKESHHSSVFIADQIAHLLVIFMITYFMGKYQMNSLFNEHMIEIFDAFGVSEMVFLSWVLKILLIHKPANVLVANILYKYKPEEKKSGDSKDKNAGRFIGTLERVIMTIFISINQYSAVGLVLTAKSIARYDKISKNQTFAEYYLLGTLLSTIYAICISLFF